jgi:transcriptional regulator with XRE-family HTH domain
MAMHVRERRLLLGMTIHDLAKGSGISADSLGDLETGRLGLTLQALAELAGGDRGRLAAEDEDEDGQRGASTAKKGFPPVEGTRWNEVPVGTVIPAEGAALEPGRPYEILIGYHGISAGDVSRKGIAVEYHIGWRHYRDVIQSSFKGCVLNGTPVGVFHQHC